MNAPHGEYVPNNLVWAILTTLFCCLPLGIVSIVYAAKVDGLRAAGNIHAARAASASARNWALASAFAAPILIALWVVFAGGMAMLSTMFGAGNY
ncbi:CD225/dispanin family protein [Marilutibacter maris]|uniref:Interferon-induced transmembrane protein 3 n=1 Tax=Marilutibacter maris TaxID=1605891 RepID=A0A2U9TDG0_9GAMM|nr:CD225/dispanin family protein [Lysobacter maris]AWV08498.1 Interferon-induced transmembrane protein 3 [Lysobacter maris]